MKSALKLIFAAAIAACGAGAASAQPVTGGGGSGGGGIVSSVTATSPLSVSGPSSAPVVALTGVIPAANLPPSLSLTVSTDDAKLPIFVISTSVFNSSWSATYFALASTTTPNPLRKNMIWLSTSNQLSFSPDGAAIQVFSTNTTAGLTIGGTPSQAQYNSGGTLAGTAGFIVNASSLVFGTAAFGVYSSSPLIVMGTAGSAAICQAAFEAGTGTLCPNGGANAAIAVFRTPGAGYIAVTDQSDGKEMLLGNSAQASFIGNNRSGQRIEVQTQNLLARQTIGSTNGGIIVSSNSHREPQAMVEIVSSGTGSIPLLAENSSGGTLFKVDDSSFVTVAASMTFKISGGAVNIMTISSNSLVNFAIEFTTKATAGTGTLNTVTCPAGKFAFTGGCNCTGTEVGVVTISLNAPATPTPTTRGNMPTAWQCQSAAATTGQDCVAYVGCSTIGIGP